MVQPRWWSRAFLGLLIVGAIAPICASLRGPRDPACGWDGMSLNEIYQVTIVDECGQRTDFCSIRCAQLWLKCSQQEPTDVIVTDEASGAKISAEDAFFVRSSVPTNNVNGNRIHAFRQSADAKLHAQSMAGRVLTGTARPFNKSLKRLPAFPPGISFSTDT